VKFGAAAVVTAIAIAIATAIATAVAAAAAVATASHWCGHRRLLKTYYAEGPVQVIVICTLL
jgi:hypothetical protein